MVGKLILSKLCKSLRLDNTDKWYMHKAELALEYEMQKFSDILR